MNTSCKILMKAAQKVMSAPFSIRGKQMGTNRAVMKLEIKVKVVICSKEPPSFWVTTAAAVAHGQMIHISKASNKMWNE